MLHSLIFKSFECNLFDSVDKKRSWKLKTLVVETLNPQPSASNQFSNCRQTIENFFVEWFRWVGITCTLYMHIMFENWIQSSLNSLFIDKTIDQIVYFCNSFRIFWFIVESENSEKNTCQQYLMQFYIFFIYLLRLSEIERDFS